MRLLILFLLLFAGQCWSQSVFTTDLNGTTINVPCGSNCSTIPVKVPHLKTTSTYTLLPIAYTPYEYITPTGNALTSLYIDDRFSEIVNIGFPFCFYDSTFLKTVVGSNGLITFDESQANRANSFTTTQPIPFAGGIPNSITGVYYPPASIMTAYTDLNPATSASPADRKIEWRQEGTAPFRRFIVSFFHVGTFGANSCGRSTPTTFQIVLHESTGVIEFFVESKICQSTSSGGRTIMGIQNWQRNKAVAAPGRNATAGWTANNEGWRFIPSGSASRFVKAELYDLNNTLVQTITTDTATTTQGLLDINFNNICFTGSKQFVVKTYFSGCNAGEQLVAADTITVTKGNLTATTSSTTANCSPSGSATITLPAGGGPYTFTLGTNTPVNSTSNTHTFTGLTAGNYTLSATNASGCGATANVTVGLSGTLLFQATPTATTCSGVNNGAILVTPQNGTGPYQYSINNGTFQPSGSFNGLAPGVYQVGVKDASGCVATTQSVTIAAGPSVTATLVKNDVSCNGGISGSVAVLVSANAVAPLQYSLDGVNFQSANTFSGLVAGSYTVYFKDANNCGGSQAFTINQPGALSQTVSVNDALCNGQNNGAITATAAGGTPPYQYSLDGTTWQNSNVLTAGAGAYTVYVRDAAGCISTKPATVNQPTVLALTVSTSNASCNGGADGQISATGSGGTPTYTYSIDGTNFQSSANFSVIQNNYTITIRDANGCTQTSNAVVGLTNNLTVLASSDTTICEGSTATLRAATNASQVLWSPSSSLTNPALSNPLASPTDTTKYVVTAILGVCTAKDSVTVNVLAAPVANAGLNDEVCFGGSYVLKGSGGNIYEWLPTTDFNPGNSSSTQNPAITPGQTITYSLMTTDNNGCRSLQPDQVTITVTPPFKVIATPRDTVVSKGDIVRLHANSPVTNYNWSPAFGLDNPDVQNPLATIDRDMTYVVTAFTGAGCKGSDTVKIKVYNGPDVYVPGAFTPNGDGKNELLMPFPVGIKELRYFRVYNRWGQIVYETKTFSQGWDGKVAGIQQPVATYVWVLEAVTKENKVITKKGTATLIR